jgi:Fe-S-cluster containining protein
MLKNVPIRILDSCEYKKYPADDTNIIGLELDIFDKRLNFYIAASGNARLAEIVPAASAICDKITEVAISHICAQGGNIPCGNACPACCNYLVSMSVPEVLYFRQEFLLKQKHHLNRIMRTYLHAARQIIKHRPPNHILESASNSYNDPSELKILADWYASLNLTCPFLRNNQCTIYEQRPFVCREHFVTGSAKGCRRTCGEAKAIEIPVQMGNILCRLSSKLCDIDDAVMMPLALAWCDINKQLCECTWPAEMMVKQLVETIKETAAAPAFH